MPRPDPGLLVRVPASTSNLGPGFDCLGLALSLFLEVRLTPHAGAGHEIDRRGPGEGELPLPRDDLLLRAFERARGELQGHYRFEVTSEIPIGRGLGSSGAAIVAGLLLARELGARLPEEALLSEGIALEGHPDNVAAALFGGLTLCTRGNGGRWMLLTPPLAANLGFAVAWPAQPLATKRARAVLPASVPFADAAENPRRLALLLEGLRSGERELVAAGAEERLHVRYRLPLLPGAERALEAAREAGAWAATLSGAGSGLVAVGARDAMEPVAQAMAVVLREATGAAEGRVLEPVFGRPVVRRL